MTLREGLRHFGHSLLSWKFWLWTTLFLSGYWLLAVMFNKGQIALNLLPMFYFAYTYGRWGGFLAGAFALPFDMTAYHLIDPAQLSGNIDRVFWITHLVAPLLFLQVGYDVELRKRVTRELSRSQELAVKLAEERDRVQRSSDEKDALLMSISHDLRTPISAMIQSAHLIEADTGYAKRYADLIQRTGHQLLQVVNELLRGYRHSNGPPVERPEPFDLRRLLAEIIELYQPLFMERGLTLALEADDALPDWVKGRVQQLRQILINLLSNSLKYTESGGAVLQVKTKDLVDEQQLEFVVVDTGRGIAEAKIAPLLNAARARPIPHTDGDKVSYGLGLGNCLRMCDRIGATLQLLPNTPNGLRAVLHLPLILSAKPRHLRERHVGVEALDGVMQVLAVDDDVASGEILLDMFKQLGCEARLARDGQTALQLVKDGTFALAVIDMQLPDTDGVQLIPRLRASNPDMTLALSSANILLTDIDQWLTPDIDLILSKPIELQELSVLCRRAKDGRVVLPSIHEVPEVEVDVRYRSIMIGYLREALAAFGRQNPSACARELHRLASAAGALHLNDLAAKARQAESSATSASRIDLFDSLRQLTRLLAHLFPQDSL